jgi:glutaredoxin
MDVDQSTPSGGSPDRESPGGSIPRVTLFHRQGCGLCAAMDASLVELQSRYTFALERVDIDSDPDLSVRFNAKVPVLALDGEILCCHFLDMPALLGELNRHD